MSRHHISLGENCLIDHLLSRYKLKEESFTFGSVRTNICYNLEILKDDFRHLLCKKYLYSVWLEEDQKIGVKNNYYKLSLDIFNETVSKDFEFTHHNVLNKNHAIASYTRKIKRFQELLASKDDIVFYYHYRYSHNNNLDALMGVFEKFSEHIKNEYNKANITYVIFYQNINTKKTNFNIITHKEYILVECLDTCEWRGKDNVFAKSFRYQFDLIFKELNNIVMTNEKMREIQNNKLRSLNLYMRFIFLFRKNIWGYISSLLFFYKRKKR